ncbi:MAG: hypothetical protein U1E83_04290 [Methylotetracoccus sp.]
MRKIMLMILIATQTSACFFTTSSLKDTGTLPPSPCAQKASVLFSLTPDLAKSAPYIEKLAEESNALARFEISVNGKTNTAYDMNVLIFQPRTYTLGFFSSLCTITYGMVPCIDTEDVEVRAQAMYPSGIIRHVYSQPMTLTIYYGGILTLPLAPLSFYFLTAMK